MKSDGEEQSDEPQAKDAAQEEIPGTSKETAQPESEKPMHSGKLIIDATVAEQAIRYPTDLNLLNEARELTEQIIDALYPGSGLDKKPRTYRQKARKQYLGLVKQRKPKAKALRKAIRQQLQYLRRNLGHIEALMDRYPAHNAFPLPRWLLYRYWVIQHLYTQQWEMVQTNSRRCDDRIVSISQPYVRPIVRGKAGRSVEFGSKMSVSLTDSGLAKVDHFSFDAFHEGADLKGQVEQYYERYGVYPQRVIADTIYGSRENRRYLKGKGIVFSGKPLGRPKKEAEENREALKREKKQRRADYLQRIPIEGKFGQSKNGYRLNYIRAKRADTTEAWINSIFLVMNLLVLLKVFFVSKSGVIYPWLSRMIDRLFLCVEYPWHYQLDSCRCHGQKLTL